MINLEDRSNTILLIKELRTEMDLTGEIFILYRLSFRSACPI